MTRIETLAFVQAVQRASAATDVKRVLETTVVARVEPKVRVERDMDAEDLTYSAIYVNALNKEMQR